MLVGHTCAQVDVFGCLDGPSTYYIADRRNNKKVRRRRSITMTDFRTEAAILTGAGGYGMRVTRACLLAFLRGRR